MQMEAGAVRRTVASVRPLDVTVTRPGTVEEIADNLRPATRGAPALALTGAGVSTDSGIPDYRGPDGRRRVAPMELAEFVGSPEACRRYWARSFVGWARFDAARPNGCHTALTALQRAGVVGGIVTQNVDGLHQRAGATDVVELHGSLSAVVCLGCGARTSRTDLDVRIRADNPGFEATSDEIRPDGDVSLEAAHVERFVVPRCAACGADLLKPDVVFFGESVPRPLVDEVFARVEAAPALLVLGTSLGVMSGLRFVRRAAARGIPVLTITRRATRDEHLHTVHVDEPLRPALERLVELVG